MTQEITCGFFHRSLAHISDTSSARCHQRPVRRATMPRPTPGIYCESRRDSFDASRDRRLSVTVEPVCRATSSDCIDLSVWPFGLSGASPRLSVCGLSVCAPSGRADLLSRDSARAPLRCAQSPRPRHLVGRTLDGGRSGPGTMRLCVRNTQTQSAGHTLAADSYHASCHARTARHPSAQNKRPRR